MLREGYFGLCIGLRGEGVGAQVVAEEEGIASVCAASAAHVYVGGARTGGGAEEALLPVAVGACGGGRAVVFGEFKARVACALQGRLHLRRKVAYGYLHVY